MMKRLFSRLYARETRAIRPDQELEKRLRGEIGLGARTPAFFRPRLFLPAGAVLALALVAFVTFTPPGRDAKRAVVAVVSGVHESQIVKEKILAAVGGGKDDWRFATPAAESDAAWGGPTAIGLGGSGGINLGLSGAAPLGLGSAPTAVAPQAAAPRQKLGLSVGGAKDVVTFRENIRNGYLPKSSSLTPEGLFNEYFFDTSTPAACAELFCPTYLRAVSPDPLSGEETRYLAVGLNSNLDADAFARKPLDTVIVLDISGSMGEGIANYYYDDLPQARPEPAEPAKTKMQAATESIAALMDHLQPDDRFGIVLFDDTAYLAKPLAPVSETNLAKIKAHVLELAPQGGTNLEAGLNEANKIFDGLAAEAGRERRMIVLTDAMPNRGGYGAGDFIRITEANAARRVYTTFIGIGLDFQTDLVEAITKVRGANYHSVFTVKEFADRLDKNFDFLVTPVAFDLTLKLEAPGYAIEKVYGSPEANESTGELMRVRTLFPSETEARGTRGGIVVLKLKKTGDDPTVRLTAGYEAADGTRHDNAATASFADLAADSYDNSGIRKGVLLSRYSDLLRDWVADELRRRNEGGEPVPLVGMERGILPYPDAIAWPLSQWEKGSHPLTVSPAYRVSFTAFRAHLEKEIPAIGDDDLRQELTLIDRVLTAQ